MMSRRTAGHGADPIFERHSRKPNRRSIESLRAEGVRILYEADGVETHPPRTGGELIATFPWHTCLDEAERLTGKVASA
jgi:hypothetical protein